MKTTKEKISQMQVIQSICVVPSVLLYFLPREFAHTYHMLLNMVLFPLLAVILSLQVKISQLSKQQKKEYADTLNHAEAMTENQEAAIVQYNSVLPDQLRCIWFFMFHHRINLILLLLPPVGLSFRIALEFWRVIPLIVLLLIPIIFLGWFLLMITAISLQVILRSVGNRGQRICTASLSVDGFRGVTPDKMQFFLWHEINQIVEHNGDIYFMLKTPHGYFVPRVAFSDQTHARMFYQAALALQSKGPLPSNFGPNSYNQENTTPNEQVWPPPVIR